MTMRDNNNTRHVRRDLRLWGRRALLTLGLLLGLGGVAMAAGPALHHHHGHPGTPEEAHAHVEKTIDHMVGAVGGTPEQRERLKALAERTFPSMEGLHGEARDLHSELHDIVTAETIDRVALEAARQDLVDLVDRGTKALFPAIADAAETLTPAQRRKISAATLHGPR